MAFELKQELKLTQSLVMTPQLQLAIKLLQLSRLELVELVREELQTNPVLEETPVAAPEEASPEPEPEKQEVDWETYLEADHGTRGGIDFSERDEEDYIGNLASRGKSLNEHLMWQLIMLALPEEEFKVGEFIIGNIDEDGYLRLIDSTGLGEEEIEAGTLDAISSMTGAAPDTAARVLATIQQLDPAGAGARHVKECLLAQAMNLPVRDTLMEEVIKGHLDAIARQNYKAVARDLSVSVEDVAEAVRCINRCLNPSPGAGFGVEDSAAIVPDIFIHKVGDDYVITMNDDGMPKLKVSPYYRQLIKGGNGHVNDDAKGYIQDKVRSALWLIKSVHQRQRTIYRVVECIVRFQREFLEKGLKHLRPLVLKDVAEEIGVHESTVSRVTSSKYVQTPRGIFELKYFFSTGMSRSDGSDVTAEYIRERVRDIVKGEDQRRPYSDQEIVDILREQGIVLARRTATKYREALGIQPSNRRRVRY